MPQRSVLFFFPPSFINRTDILVSDSQAGFEYLNPEEQRNDTHLFYWWNGRNILEWAYFIFLGDTHYRTHSAFTGLAQIQLHLSTIKEALAQYAAFLLAIYGSICVEQAAITSLNSVKVTVVSGACGCDFQSIQRGLWGGRLKQSGLSLAAWTSCSGWNLDPAWVRFPESSGFNRHLKWSSDGGTTE